MTPVRIPPTLRTATGGQRQVEIDGSTVGELLEDDELVPFVNVYVEGEDVRTRDGLETPVAESSTVILLPAMAGG